MGWAWPNGSQNPPNVKPGGGTWADAPNSDPNSDGLVVSSEFNDADHGGSHSGIDLVGFDGNNRAASDGVVVRAGDNGDGYGKAVIINHDDGSQTIYGHHSEIYVGVGQRVSQGTVLGYWGDTGHAYGVHLHFGTSYGQSNADPWVNPRDFMASKIAGSGFGPPSGIDDSVPTSGGWTVGQTDFTGVYGENNLNGAKWYVIEPTTDSSKTISAICDAYSVSLDAARAYTAKVAGSQWASQLLQAGSSWWDGTDTYYAGQAVALNDVAAILDAYQAEQVAAQAAAAQAKQEAETAALANQGAELTRVADPFATSATLIAPVVTDAVTPVVPTPPKEVKVPVADMITEDQKTAITQIIQDAVKNTPTDNTGFWKTIAKKEFWGDLTQRALNTFLQVGMATVATGAIGITELDYSTALNLGATGALISVVTTLVRVSGGK